MTSQTSDEDDGQFSPDFDPSQIFIGREHQMDLFNLYLNRWKKLMNAAPVSGDLVTVAPNPNNKIQGLVVLLYGRGGFGKSTLLKRYREMALEQDSRLAVSKIIDWEFAVEGKRALFNPAPGQQVDASEYFKLLCGQLSYALGRRTDEFREYQKAVEAVQYARREARSILDNLEKDDRYAWLRKIASEEVVAVLRTAIPGANLVPGIDIIAAGAIRGLDQAIKIGADQAKQLYTKLSDRLKEKLDDYLGPALKLGLSLGRDLSNLARNFPLLIFFDTYEEIDEGDPLFKLVMGAAGVRVGWVLAGRDNLWAGLEQRMRSLGLDYGYKDIVPSDRGLAVDFNVGGVGAFTISNILEYFAHLSKNRSSQPLVLQITEKEASRILEVTQGVPLAIKIAADLYLETADLELITAKADGKREIVDEMTRRYLLHTQADPSERARLFGLALLRRSDEPAAVITALYLSPEQAKTSYEAELSRLHRRYSFIFTEKERPSLHMEVRHFLRLWLLEHRRDPEVVAVNERLKESHTTVLREMEESRQYSSLRDRLEDEEWVGVYLDLIEQQFWLDAAEGVRFCLPFVFAAAIYLRNANRDAIEVGAFFQSVVKKPYRNWWMWAADSLFYPTSNNPSSEALNGLEELARLASIRCPTFPQPVPDFLTELEAALWWRLGEAYRGKDDQKSLEWYEKALTRLSRLTELREEAAKAAAVATEKLYEENKYAECINLLNRAIELKPDYAWAYIIRGRAYVALKEYQRAIEDYTWVILKLKIAAVYSNRGVAYHALKEYQQAIEDFTRAIKLDPKIAVAYTNRGRAYYYLEEYQQAIEDFTRAIKIDPKNATAYFNRGLAYDALKEYQQAIEDYSRAIELDPNYATAYFNRGLAYRALKEYQQAIEDYSQAIELDPNYATAYFNRGLAYDALKEYQQAIEDYSRAIELDPNYATVYSAQGAAYVGLKEYQRAIEDYSQAIELDPKNATDFSNRGLSYLRLENRQQARDDYSRSWELDRTNINAAWMAEWIEMDKERTGVETAIRLEEISTTNPEHYIASVCLGVAFGLRNKLREGLSALEHAISLVPEECDAYFWKGMLCAYLGRNLLAIEALEKALNVNLPPLLLTPLYWLEKDRPKFYCEYAAALLARYNV
jgi:tetratricopeptide (TPR) repeat protein